MIILNPEARPREVELPLAPRHADLNGKVVGLLDNVKTNGDVILDTVESELRRRYKIADVVRIRKPTASRSAEASLPSDQFEALLGCDVVVTAIGD